MSSPLERWRERCRWGIDVLVECPRDQLHFPLRARRPFDLLEVEPGTPMRLVNTVAVTLDKRHWSGFLLALRVTASCSGRHQLTEAVIIMDAMTSSLHTEGVDRPALNLALAWLREEVERG